MPQLVKGGKYVFGWTALGKDRSIRIPDEAFEEYCFKAGERIMIILGSRSSGGFSIHTQNALKNSKIGVANSGIFEEALKHKDL
jgi:hypothetical protein